MLCDVSVKGPFPVMNVEKLESGSKVTSHTHQQGFNRKGCFYIKSHFETRCADKTLLKANC